MSVVSNVSLRRLLGASAAVVVLCSGCGSSSETTEPADPTPDQAETTLPDSQQTEVAADSEDGEPTEAATTESVATEAVATGDTATEASTGDSVIRFSGGSTDPWEIAGTCEWTPDNTGAASQLWAVVDVDEEREEEVTILEAWPMSIDDDSEPTIIGSVVEPGGNVLIVSEAEATQQGETITVDADAYDVTNLGGGEPDYNLTVTCGP